MIRGISWPFRIANNGLPAPAQGTDAIRSALVLLLKTPKGSRVMRPELGTNLNRLLFETQGPFLQALVRREILSAVSDFLPQVRISDIVIQEDGPVLRLNIFYVIQGVEDQTGFFTVENSA